MIASAYTIFTIDIGMYAYARVIDSPPAPRRTEKKNAFQRQSPRYYSLTGILAKPPRILAEMENSPC
ncbi:uncharacterized protein TrAFT101_010724 [Trichoderma asperellum]|uniref:uncharacterized protein n=1 Tax=Trichoderma asperellum TaxID=101201 RepID=UPI00331DA7A4|nr:hypothetical protein TrAFT101_010724 [Trichoderma asperellum]